MDIKQEVEQSGTVNPEYIKLENEDPDYGVQCNSLQVGELDKSSLDTPKHEDIWLGMKKEASEADSKKHEKPVDINPEQLRGESDSKIESSMTTDATYESVLQRIKAEHIEENWDEEDLSVNIEQIKKEQHPAVAIKCEKSEEPDMDNIKTENMDISELNEELDIKPDDEAALSSDLAARAMKKEGVEKKQGQDYRKSEEVFICYKCYKCNYTFQYKRDLMNHIKSNCSIKTDGKAENASKRLPAVTCLHCSSTFKSKRVRDNHIIKQHPDFVASTKRKIHECSHCEYKTTIKRSFKKHMWTHSIGQLFTCQHCTSTFKSKLSLEEHVVKKHPEFIDSIKNRRIYECSYCTYKTTVKFNLVEHMSDHLGYSLKTCQHCGATFKRKYFLEDHIVRKHPDFFKSVNKKIYECSSCTFKTISKYIFEEHMSRHFNDKLKTCKHSDISFRKEKHARLSCIDKTSSNHKIIDHTMTNSSEQCTSKSGDFDVELKNKQCLDDHIIKKHPDFIASVTTKIYECSYCAYKTTVKTYLNKHMSIHSVVEIPCDHCDITFKTKRSLNDHIVKKHPDFSTTVSQIIYDCPKCEFKTVRQHGLKRHMLTHPEEL